MSEATRRIEELSPQEKRALLARLMRESGRTADPTALPVNRLFEAQVARTPHAVAAGFEGATITFDDLNTRANRLAHYLKAQGVGPEVMVGLCVERGLDMLVGLLGVLKAGGAYVPIDPGFPAGRIRFMLQDASVSIVVTERSLRERLSGLAPRLVCLDDLGEELAIQPASNPETSTNPSNLAYAIYTSGSTGNPKGVLIPHRALTNFLSSMRRQPGLGGQDTLLAVTTLSFDIAALELFLPLVVGARVEIAPREAAVDSSRLGGLLASSGATVMQATPATWRMLLDSGWAGSKTLKALCGGEALTRDLAERLSGKVGELWNLYGPTETTVWSTLAKVVPGDGPVSIGRPIANTRTYVLDSHLRPVPVGVPGELYLGGSGLARGYHDRPGLTAERFAADPFAPEPGARIYRTGDLARLRPDGSLECLGRLDSQVKVRGYRIELGEVEAALLAHPALLGAAAVAREDASGENRLIGYLVPREGEPSSEADLRTWLHDRLPEYMIPSVFVTLDALPLTPNGKIDRNALPDPEPDRSGVSAPAVAPRGPIEEAVAAIWSEVLGRGRVSVFDDFFELGGHSLMAAQLLARVRESLAVEISLKSLFDTPTVAGLSRQVEESLRSGAGLVVPPLEPVGRDGPMPASFAQQRLWFLDQLDPGSPMYNIPAEVRLTGTLDRNALGRAFTELVRRQESLRTTFASQDGLPVQTIAPEMDADLPLEDLTNLPESEREEEARRRAREESWRPFDLVRGPLFRARLYRLGPEDHLVTVAVHHIIADGWSIGVIIRDTAELYEAFASGKPSPLPSLPVQYADYAVWQRLWLQGDALEGQLRFWREVLAGVPVLELPTDRPRPSALSGRGGQRLRIFPAELGEALRALGRGEGATLFMTLLAGFQAVLSRYSGQADFAVGTPVAGRTWSQVEGLVGLFVNTIALRADLSREPSFRELLRRVKRAALDGFARQDLPFDQIVNALGLDRDPSRSPVFQVLFVLQNAPLPALEATGLSMVPLEIESVTSKFELTLSVTETPEGLKAALEYSTDLFDEGTADRLLSHLQILLESAVEGPDKPVASLPMMTEEEQRMLLNWNGDATRGDGDSDENETLLAGLDNLSDDELDALIDGF
jgi:amino acid adenylation domain-containing protein